MVKKTVSAYNEFDEGTHYLSSSEKQKEDIIKKRKFFKRLLALALALVLSNVVSNVERAEAATCPPHEEYYETVMSVRDIGGPHRVQKHFYAYDDQGNLVDITDLLEPVYVTCIVSMQEEYRIVRCKKCKLEIYSYYYRTPEMHSYCAVG